MAINIRLRDVYGADFTYPELDHWLALRGWLFWCRKEYGPSPELTAAIKEVTDTILEDAPRIDLSRERAPNDLFDHYFNVVSQHWRWMRNLRR